MHGLETRRSRAVADAPDEAWAISRGTAILRAPKEGDDALGNMAGLRAPEYSLRERGPARDDPVGGRIHALLMDTPNEGQLIAPTAHITARGMLETT